MADTPKVYVLCDLNCKFEGMTKEQIYAAIVQAVNEGTIGDIDTGFVQTIKTINGKALKFFVGEQYEYEALSEDDREGLFAIITNDVTKESILTAVETLQNTVDDMTNTVDKVVKGLEDGTRVVAKAKSAEEATKAFNIEAALKTQPLTKTGIYLVISQFSYDEKKDGCDITTIIAVRDLDKDAYACATQRTEAGGSYHGYGEVYYNASTRKFNYSTSIAGEEVVTYAYKIGDLTDNPEGEGGNNNEEKEKLIKFTVDGVSYSVDIGATWYDWYIEDTSRCTFDDAGYAIDGNGNFLADVRYESKILNTDIIYSGAFVWKTDSVATFTINSITYELEEGMTWAAWVASDYNTKPYYVTNGYISLSATQSAGVAMTIIDNATPTDLIVGGTSYVHTTTTYTPSGETTSNPFTIDGVKYYSPTVGSTTWGDWINSSYNTGGFFADNGSYGYVAKTWNVEEDTGTVVAEANGTTPVFRDNYIVAGDTYKLMTI